MYRMRWMRMLWNVFFVRRVRDGGVFLRRCPLFAGNPVSIRALGSLFG